MEEIWKDIEGYEGYYQVSSLGRVKSLPITYGQKYNQRPYEKILTPIKDAAGYYRVHLRRDGRDKRISVHRLVAIAFIDNPLNLKFVNHKDEDKTNNHANNLEWCTAKYNCNYGTAIQRRRNAFVQNHGRAVDQYDMDGNFIRHFGCLRDVRFYGFNPANVHCCCTNKNGYTQTGGYKWRFSNTK